jgi:hypothetical protein
MLFYTVMKPVVRLGLRVFFRRLEVRGGPAGPRPGGAAPTPIRSWTRS